VKSPIAKMDNPEIIIIITSTIDKTWGTLCFSSHFIIGNMAEASKTAIVKGKITVDAIFNTAATRIQHMKIMIKKMARPELKVLNLSFTPVLWHIFYKWTTKPGYF
jgi:hypothetical protein